MAFYKSLLAGVTEELRNSLLIFVVHTQCHYGWPLCLDGFPQVFYDVFQVLAGVTEELRNSLQIFVVYTQCCYSYQLCMDDLPCALRSISVARWHDSRNEEQSPNLCFAFPMPL